MATSSMKAILRSVDQTIEQEKQKVAALRKEWHDCRERAWEATQDNSAAHAMLAARDGECDFDFVEAANDHRRAVNRYNNFHRRAWRIVAELMGRGEEPTGGCACGACDAWRTYHLARFRSGNLGECALVWISESEASKMAADWKEEAEKAAEREWEAEREWRAELAARDAEREARLWR